MQQQQPNIYFVNSSFERHGGAGGNQYRYAPCCVTPESMAPAERKGRKSSACSNKLLNRQDRMMRGRTSSESKKLPVAKQAHPNQQKHQRPETFYINTITNNYYQVKKRQNA